MQIPIAWHAKARGAPCNKFDRPQAANPYSREQGLPALLDLPLNPALGQARPTPMSVAMGVWPFRVFSPACTMHARHAEHSCSIPQAQTQEVLALVTAGGARWAPARR